MCIFTWTVLRSFIQLGDTESYLTDLNISTFSYFSSTSLMRLVGVTSSQILGDFTINLITCILVTKLIILYIRNCKLPKNQKLLLYVIFSFPSFTIWTVLYSKEAIVSLAFLSFFILIQEQPRQNKKFAMRITNIFLAVMTISIFKPQYLIFILTILLSVWLARRVKPTIALQLYILYSILLYIIYLLVSDLVHYYTSGLFFHFNISGSSTRDDIFFNESGDFLAKAPYGIYLALMQFKLNEIFGNLFSLILWFEALVICVIAALIFLFRSRNIIYGRLSVYYFATCIIGILLLLLAFYPFGVFNPGSANRYKTAIYVPLFLTLITHFPRKNEGLSGK